LFNFLKKFKWADWLFFVLVMFALFIRFPTIVEQYKNEGTAPTPVSIEGKLYPPTGAKSVLVFWATWCGPCTLELNRIKNAIAHKEISANNIFAVNMGESKHLVQKTILEREYNFQVVIDDNGLLASRFHVQATPSIAFIDEKGKIEWLSSGLSPTLIYRIKSFL
jgi:thioredoxin-related protein